MSFVGTDFICATKFDTFKYNKKQPLEGVNSFWGPIFSHQPQSKAIFTNSSGLIIACSADGYPKPLISWTFGLNRNKVYNIPDLLTIKTDSSLVFSPFKANQYQKNVHQNTYQCHASNKLGTISSKIITIKAGKKKLHHFFECKQIIASLLNWMKKSNFCFTFILNLKTIIFLLFD